MIYADLCYKIVGAAMKVHAELGCGFDEKVYQEALAIQFEEDGIPFDRERQFRISYHGQELQHFFQPDFVVDGRVIVELKSVVDMQPVFEAQAINYLYAADMPLALLINFGQPALYKKYFVNSRFSESDLADCK